ncbi:patatin-like phospholipase family protein [Flavobacterium marginilacus]|uniref:patatin-like phospholipase family protein n=1 Tax=Flavobacterium marginilacus TaxID=3003256 RepID=UPI00248E0A8D|nr:patatin-like phospholipase family protein [Flavobacterium marginilacus]
MRIEATAKRQQPKVKIDFVCIEWAKVGSSLFFILKAFFLIAYCLLPIASNAQDAPKRPKIGLVLSGGGAKGFAHIGVLNVLEDAGIKIDYIGGTSMGAVIGGLYAMGYNAKQIDSIIDTTNFSNVINDFIPRSSKNFYEKRNDELYALILPFNKFSIGTPEGLSKGMYNFNLLSRLTFPVRHVRNFNELPIPFVCVGTNIALGEQVVFDKGILSQAITGSASLPSIFAPIIIDNNLIIDGGVINNYPIDEVRKMGADIIIGVDVQSGLLSKDELRSASKVFFQITNLQMIERMKTNANLTEIYIKPDVKNYGVVSFEKAAEIIKKGEDAAFSIYEKIDLLVDKANPYHKPKLKVQTDSLNIVSIKINELKNYSRDYIIGKLNFKPKSKISFRDLETGINNLNATQNFSNVSYYFDKNGEYDDLVLTLTESPVKTNLKFALHYDGLYKSAVLANITNKKTFFKNDFLSADLVLGDNLRYYFDYYIDNGFQLSYGFKSQLNQFNKNVPVSVITYNINGINSINIDYLNLSNQVYIQSLFAQKFLIGVGAEFEYLDISSETLELNSNITKSTYGSVFGYIKYDSYDNKYFPKKGWYFSANPQFYMFSSESDANFNPFFIVKGEAGIAKTVFKNATIKFQTEAGTPVGDKSIPYFDFILGGYGYYNTNNFKYFYGYDFLSISGSGYLESTITFDYEVFKKNHINFSANYANLGDDLYKSLDWISLPKYSGYALGYGLETVIGPVEIKYSWSPEISNSYLWFSVGFIF